MSVHTAVGTRIHITGQEPTPPTSDAPMSANQSPNPNGSTCVMPVSNDESPVYLRTFGNLVHLVDASGNKLGEQESVDVGIFASGEIQRVTVTLAHQGFWHEGLSRRPGKLIADEVREALRASSASRSAYYGAQLDSGVGDRGDLVEAVTLLRKEMREQADLIRKRMEDAGALLRKWDRAGVPAAHVDCGISVAAQEAKPLDTVEGMALSVCLDPLESAISLTVNALGDEFSRMSDLGATTTTVYQQLCTHLDALLAKQLDAV